MLKEVYHERYSVQKAQTPVSSGGICLNSIQYPQESV